MESRYIVGSKKAFFSKCFRTPNYITTILPHSLMLRVLNVNVESTYISGADRGWTGWLAIPPPLDSFKLEIKKKEQNYQGGDFVSD